VSNRKTQVPEIWRTENKENMHNISLYDSDEAATSEVDIWESCLGYNYGNKLISANQNDI